MSVKKMKYTPHSRGHKKLLAKLVAEFIQWNGKERQEITLVDIKQFLKESEAPINQATFLINRLAREKFLVRKGFQKDGKPPAYIVVANLPINVTWNLSKETTTRLIGTCMNMSAQMARLTYQARVGGTSV